MTENASPDALPRVILVDDHAVIRDGVRLLLETSGLAQVVAEAADGEEAVRQIEWHRPDLVVLDVDLPGLNGFQVLNRLLDMPDRCKILMLSMYSDAGVANSLLQVGASGFVCKRSGLSEVVKAIKAILADEVYRTEGSELKRSPEARSESERLAKLSAREREVLIHLARGSSAKLTAQAMKIMPSTVHVYRTKIREKLEITSLAELARLAIRHGLSEQDPESSSGEVSG